MQLKYYQFLVLLSYKLEDINKPLKTIEAFKDN
jgi:hypothetical protein